LKIMNQPGQAFELQPFNNQPKLYTVDSDGALISEIGTENDPWIVTATLATGSGALINTATCEFIQGYCEFTDLGLDTMGSGYAIDFEITYPTTSTLASAVSDAFAVGGRPIGIQFTELPTLQPVATPFTCTVTAWDEALDQAAELSKLPSTSVTCELLLFDAKLGVLEGTTSAVMTDGVATFDDLTINEIEEGISIRALCEDDGDFAKVVMSAKFNIHSFPETGMLQETDTGFTYKGSAEYVSTVLEAFEGLIKSNQMSAEPRSAIAATKTEDVKDDKVFLTKEIMAMWPEM